MKNKKNAKIIIGMIVLVYIIVGILIPIIFKYTIFENHTLSNLSNNEWAGFLGSYAGGILGGLGTLIAVYITVKSSMSIQEENKEETEQRIEKEYERRQAEIAEENRRRDNERNSIIEENNKRDRKQFVNCIAKELGIYITHISKYHYANLRAEKLEKECNSAQKELCDIEKKKKKFDDNLSAVNKSLADSVFPVTHNLDSIFGTYLEQVRIQDEKERLNRIYNEKLAEQRSNSEFANRLLANEAYFTLKVMLGNIDLADNLLDKLEEVHKKAGMEHPEDEINKQWIELMTGELIQAFTVFMNKYVEEGGK